MRFKFHRFTILLLTLTLYIVIKLLIISNTISSSADRYSHEGHLTDLMIRTSLTETTTPALTADPRLIHLSTSNCSGEDLGVPQMVRAVGCSGDQQPLCEVLTCRNLLFGTDAKVYELAHEFMKAHKKTLPTDEDIAKSAEDCEGFKQLRGYRLEPTLSDIDFPIAFNILVHINVGQMERLLHSIYRSQNVYCIHVDGKSSETVRSAVMKIAKCFDNVYLSSKVEKVIYAGFTRLKADLNCMEDHVRHPSVKWKYLINLAAQSFPLQTPEDMVRILRIYNGSNDIEGIYGNRILQHRFEREWEERTDSFTVNKTGKRNPSPPHDLDIVRGSVFGVFSRPFVEFVLTDKVAQDLLEWSKKTYSPDEHFWATLHHTYTNPHLHTPGSYSGLPNDKLWLAVFVKWGRESNCHGTFVRGICILGVGDLPDLIFRREFFVNKFYDNHQPLALDCMEAWLKHKENCPVPFDYDFYNSLPFRTKY